MATSDTDFGAGFAFGVILTFVVFVVLGIILIPPWEETRFEGVCEYLKGEVQGDVCLKDSKVVYKKP